MLQSKTYYSYDERGNLSGEQTRTYASEGLAGSTAEQAGLSNDANSVKTYHYDRFNRLVEYTDGDTVAEYEYNADNLRTAKTVNGRRTDYVWDGTNLRYETGGNGTHEYVYDPTGVHMMDGNYYVKDGHGNVTGMYDANAEFVSDTYYDAFGNITYGDAPDPFGYSGEYHDSETGLIYLRNRYYDSSTGRFITEDPAKDGVNWYSYCGGDPVNFVDPTGEYYIRENSDGTYTAVKSNIFSAFLSEVATAFVPSSIVSEVEYNYFRIVGGNSATDGDAGNDMNQQLIEQAVQGSGKVFQVIGYGQAIYGACKGIAIVDMDNIAFGLMSKAGVSTTASDYGTIDGIVQFTYGFIQNNTYFTESLGNFFNNETAHWVDYQLSLSDDPGKDIERYKKRAYNYYCGLGYDPDQAKGIANGIESYLKHYDDRRNEVFSMYGDYINNLM